MQYALDSNDIRVNIHNAHVNEKYYCECCGEELVQKKGEVRRWHFAHKRNTACTDKWTYDEMNYWHNSWQEEFPEDCREVVFNNNGEKHRTDIFLKDVNTIIEFQHSSISSEEFTKRNLFYTSLGSKIVWVFDFVEQYDDRIRETRTPNIYRWNNPPKTFNDFNCKNTNVEVYFQLFYDEKQDEYLQGILKNINDYHDEDSIDKSYYYTHQNEEAEICQLIWISDNGLECFRLDSVNYNLNQFIQMINRVKTKDEICKEIVSNYGHSIYELWQDNFKVAIFENLLTGVKVKIGRSNEKKTQFSKWFGYLGTTNGKFYDDRREIYRARKKEWKCVWHIDD